MTTNSTYDISQVSSREWLLLSMFEQHLNVSCWPQSALCIMYSRVIQLRTVRQMETSVCPHTGVFWGRNVLNVDVCYESLLRSRPLECESLYATLSCCAKTYLVFQRVSLVKGMGKKKIIPWDYRFLLNSLLLHLDLHDKLELQGQVDMARIDTSLRCPKLCLNFSSLQLYLLCLPLCPVPHASKVSFPPSFRTVEFQ